MTGDTNVKKMEGDTKESEVKKSREICEKYGTSNWALVSPAKIGRSQLKTPPKNELEVQISASKFSVLSIEEEAEKGEIETEEQDNNDDEVSVASEQMRELDSDLLEDVILAQQVKGKDRAGTQRGVKRNQKAKALDVNLKSTRHSRRKH